MPGEGALSAGAPALHSWAQPSVRSAVSNELSLVLLPSRALNRGKTSVWVLNAQGSEMKTALPGVAPAPSLPLQVQGVDGDAAGVSHVRQGRCGKGRAGQLLSSRALHALELRGAIQNPV